MTFFSGPTGPKISLTGNQVIMPYPVGFRTVGGGRFVNRPYDKDNPLRRTRQSLPCVKGGGICEANDGGIVNNPRMVNRVADDHALASPWLHASAFDG